MTYKALIKFAPLDTLERRRDPDWNRADRSLYGPGRFMFKPGLTQIPLLVDHQDDQQVGIVDSIFRADEVDVVAGQVESGPWLVASATVTDPPRWLREHETKASFSFAAMSRGTFIEAEHIMSALVNEVSILSPGKEPAEPLACVTFLRTVEAAAPVEELYGGGPLIRRNIGRVLAIRDDDGVETVFAAER